MQTMGLVTAGARYDLTHLSDGALLAGTRRLVGTSNQLFADLLAHLAEVEARGVHRTRACASLYTYCIYELRLSEDAAFRRVSAARLVKSFPALFAAIAAGELHLTGILMLGPHLTHANHLQLLARAKHRTKRELARLIRQIDPQPDVPARIEPLGPPTDAFPRSLRKPTWEQSTTALTPIRELTPGERPRDWIDQASLAVAIANPETETETETTSSDLVATRKDAKPPLDDATPSPHCHLLSWPIQGPQRYAVQFTATEEYATLVDRAKALLSHSSEGCSLAELHLKALRVLVEQLEKRKYGTRTGEAAPGKTIERVDGVGDHATQTASRSACRTTPSTNGRPSADTRVDASLATTPAAPPTATPSATTDEVAQDPRQRGRYVPASIRREVYRRDEGRCTYVDSQGSRCRETHGLELHHRQPFARRGAHSAANLTLHCRAHNALCAEQDFGRSRMNRKRTKRRHEP